MIAAVIFSVGVEQLTVLDTHLVPVSWAVRILFYASLCSAHRSFLSFPLNAHWWHIALIKATCVFVGKVCLCGRYVWMDVAWRRPLEQRLSPWLTLSCPPSGWDWPWSRPPLQHPLSSWQRPPAAGFGLQAAELLTRWFFRWHLLVSRKRALYSLFLTQLFPCVFYWVNCWSQSWIALPFPPRTRIPQESSLHLKGWEEVKHQFWLCASGGRLSHLVTIGWNGSEMSRGGKALPMS